MPIRLGLCGCSRLFRIKRFLSDRIDAIRSDRVLPGSQGRFRLAIRRIISDLREAFCRAGLAQRLHTLCESNPFDEFHDIAG
jgi:hypothetical protein